MTAIHSSWFPVARLLRPQGRRGEFLAELETDLDVFRPGTRFALAPAEAGPATGEQDRELESSWRPTGRNAGRIVLKLQGIDSIAQAEALAGQFLLLPDAQLPPLDPDTYLVRDLVGCSLYDGDTLAGTVVDVQFPVGPDGRTRLTDAPDLLAVTPPRPSTDSGNQQPEPVLIPFVRAWIRQLDLPAHRIVMSLPPGLLHEPGDEADDRSPDSPLVD